VNPQSEIRIPKIQNEPTCHFGRAALGFGLRRSDWSQGQIEWKAMIAWLSDSQNRSKTGGLFRTQMMAGRVRIE
jgi:hypothetical protein